MSAECLLVAAAEAAARRRPRAEILGAKLGDEAEAAAAIAELVAEDLDAG